MSRLAIVLSHPVQYYSPWFRWLRANTPLAFRVFYLWDFGVTRQRDPEFGTAFQWDVDLLSGYDHEFVPNVARRPGTDHFSGLNNPLLRERLQVWKPAAILLFGYNYRTHLGLIARPPAPLIFRGDSHLIDQTPSVGKRFLLRQLFARFAAITYVGQANREYFATFGVPEGKLYFAPHAVEAARFAPNETTRFAAQHLREELLIGLRKVVLFAGKFLPAKQPRELLAAFLRIAPRDAALVFVGDGSEKAALEKMAGERPDCCVRFLPFANQSEMPVRYALADLFALPSRGLYETWGLAVNEAMHGGVPCLVSDRVGCQRDLVRDGQTGFVFRASELGGLDHALGRALVALRGGGQALSESAIARVSAYNYAVTSQGLLGAMQHAVTHG